MKSFDGLEVNSGLFVTNLTSVITRTMQGYHLSFFPTFVFSRCFFSFHIFSLLNLKAMFHVEWKMRKQTTWFIAIGGGIEGWDLTKGQLLQFFGEY